MNDIYHESKGSKSSQDDGVPVLGDEALEGHDAGVREEKLTESQQWTERINLNTENRLEIQSFDTLFS